IMNDSFAFLLRPDHVQPTIGYLPFTIVPPDPLHDFIPDVPLLVTTDNFNLVTSDPSQEKSVVSLGLIAQPEILGKLTQARWQETGSWGGHSAKEPTVDGKISPTRAVWPPPTTKVSLGTAIQPLMVITPLAVVIFLLIEIAVALCGWLLGQK
uniref:Uncharacterized protein n=1 Tax=Loxodonta africana TaxID=9785 RepID=G3UJV3_LOXAF